VSRPDMETMAYWSNIKAWEATKAGKFKDEIVPIEGEKEDGTKFLVDRDQWVRESVSMEKWPRCSLLSSLTVSSPRRPLRH